MEMEMPSNEADIRRMENEIDKRARDLQYRKEEILNLNIRHIQEFVWSFTRAYENGDIKRCGRIFDIMITLSHVKEEIPTLQKYFGGEKIGKYKSTVNIHKASQWITFIGELIMDKEDWRIKPSRIS